MDRESFVGLLNDDLETEFQSIVAEALRPLLDETQEHVLDLRTALGD